ncbi:hypothetical protein HK405_007531, partial [Cladochytrium tenue]
DLANLAPRKPGFDLARELAGRYERLERETDFCIAEHVRERLKASHDISALGGAGAGPDADDDDDDE